MYYCSCGHHPSKLGFSSTEIDSNLQMFSSTYTSNPFQSFPSSSSYPPIPFYIDPENAFASDTILHDPLGVPFMPTTQAPIPETVTNLTVADYAAMLQRDANGDGSHYGGVSNFLTRKPAAKKDRHSKIFTSQGLRDRRVRLSSQIARKFFDLQDMLEYDKASNTLEWLFTKSENAIRELARSKHSCSGDANCFCFSPELQGVGVDSNDKSLVGANATGAAEERKVGWVEKEDVCLQAKKGSREKARARARERASSNKITHGRVKDMEERFLATADPQILHQLMPPIQPQEDCARWPDKLVHPHTHLLVLDSEAPRDGFDPIEEFVLKSNLKPSLVSSHHQNLEIPKEISVNNNDYHSFPNSPPNWDTNEAISGRSSFYGIASMNLSTEHQIFGKSWEGCTNQRPH